MFLATIILIKQLTNNKTSSKKKNLKKNKIEQSFHHTSTKSRNKRIRTSSHIFSINNKQTKNRQIKASIQQLQQQVFHCQSKTNTKVPPRSSFISYFERSISFSCLDLVLVIYDRNNSKQSKNFQNYSLQFHWQYYQTLSQTLEISPC